MKFILATKKPVVQIKTTSTGDLSKGEILVLVFLKNRTKQGKVETTYSEIVKGLNISRIMAFNAIKNLLLSGIIVKLTYSKFQVKNQLFDQ